jgi:hypothetical protein
MQTLDSFTPARLPRGSCVRFCYLVFTCGAFLLAGVVVFVQICLATYYVVWLCVFKTDMAEGRTEFWDYAYRAYWGCVLLLVSFLLYICAIDSNKCNLRWEAQPLTEVA